MSETAPEIGFADRHVGPDEADVEAMLAVLGRTSLDDLISDTVPAAILRDRDLDLPAARSEAQALEDLRAMAAANTPLRPMLGMGYADTITPPVILRNVLENPAWYTAYTPYQPEIAQGRLEALINFQTAICDLTGMEIANASLLDEGTAAAEAATLCHSVSGVRDANLLLIDADTHPQTIAVMRTRAEPLDVEVMRSCSSAPRRHGTASDRSRSSCRTPGRLGQFGHSAPTSRPPTPRTSS